MSGFIDTPPKAFITILVASGRCLTKRFWLAGGVIKEASYDHARHYNFHEIGVKTIDGLFHVISEFPDTPNVCLIRGQALPGLIAPCHRISANFPMPSEGVPWVMIDIDGLVTPPSILPYTKKAIDYAIRQLPKCFHNVSCVAQFSSSAGVLNPDGTPYKEGIRLHLFYLLDRPVSNEELKALLRDYPVDRALFQAVQPHYIAEPVLGAGVECRVKQRVQLIEKSLERVPFPAVSLPTKGVRRSRTVGHSTSTTEWEDPSNGLPSPEDMMHCDFMQWFVGEPSIGTGRYPAARAFASNACRTAGESIQLVIDGLNANRADGYEHTDQIVAGIEQTRPITCRWIYDNAYQCPQLDVRTGRCNRAPTAATPFGLGRAMKRRRDE